MNFRPGIALVAFAAGAAANANLVANGSFENLTGTTIDNWFLTPPAASGSVGDYPGAGTSIYGNRFLTLNPGASAPAGSATNDFSTTALGVEYRVDFVYGQFGGVVGDQTLTVEIAYGSVPTLIQSAVFTNITPATDFGTIWRQGSFTFMGVGLPTSITFSDVGSTGFTNSDLLVDNVSIEAVPEPTTLAALGLGALALLRRRRQQG